MTSTSSSQNSHSAPQRSQGTVLIVLRGIGPPPSFKNSKMLTRGKLITHPRNQKWMKAAQDIIASQLLSKYPTGENETVTAASLRSWIASSLPEDDSCRYLTECSCRFMSVPKKQEGALIIVEQITNHERNPKP